MSNIEDQYHRTFKTLRISLTNACNLGCLYCVRKEDDHKILPADTETLSLDNMVRTIAGLNDLLPLETIRLTGGEPTLFKGLIPLVKNINALGITNIKMTSNGYLLADMVEALAHAGLKEVNISLDAIDAEVFYKVSRRKNSERIFDAIDRCIQYGIEVKLNAVILKGVNDCQIVPLLKYAAEKNISVRFLELMKMGYLFRHDFDSYFYSEQDILSTIAKVYKFTKEIRLDGATANYWNTKEGHRFGIIANESSPFCEDCNRLRLDSYGNVFGCLSENIPVPVFDALESKEELTQRLKVALSHKQSFQFKGSELNMMAIGG